jgi:tRNA(adenine34) deaminase
MASSENNYWMLRAIDLAREAENKNEVPVGAVVVVDNEVVGAGFNRPISSHDPTAHAEIMAIREAAAYFGNYRLPSAARLYVTLEPCAMCAGAMIHARVNELIYGASDPKTGAAGSVFEIAGTDDLNHKIKVTGGVLEDECADLLREFFQRRR